LRLSYKKIYHHVMSFADRSCITPGCGKPAGLQCPTCAKLSIGGSFFCEQACFKAAWKAHKGLHKKAESEKEQLEVLLKKVSNSSMDPANYNPWPGYGFTGKLRPSPKSEKRVVPPHIQRPDYADHKEGYPKSEVESKRSHLIQVQSAEQIAMMRKVCRFAREVLDAAARAVRPGITTDEIDRIVHEETIKRDCYPSPLNYYTFPKSCCTSINEVICHGIPDDRPLEEGDIVNLDITCFYNGYHGDLNETLFVGKCDEESVHLVKTAYECLMASVNEVKPNAKYRDMGAFIQKHAQANNLQVTRTYCGHGINALFHTAPSVPHYAKNKAVGVMKPGHCFTIEPMINKGTWRDQTWPDDWTAVTQDGKRSAQFEQTLLVTEDGVDILTRRLEKNGQPYFMDQLAGEAI